MAFECNLAAGNKAACQQHVIRQSVQHQQVLPEITGAPQAVHEPPRQNTLGTSSGPGGAPALQTPERPSSAIPGSLARNEPIFRDLNGTFGAKGGAEMAGFITQ